MTCPGRRCRSTTCWITGERTGRLGLSSVFRVLRRQRREIDWRWTAGEVDEHSGDAEFFPLARSFPADRTSVQRGRMQVEWAESGDAERCAVEKEVCRGSENCGANAGV